MIGVPQAAAADLAKHGSGYTLGGFAHLTDWYGPAGTGQKMFCADTQHFDPSDNGSWSTAGQGTINSVGAGVDQWNLRRMSYAMDRYGDLHVREVAALVRIYMGDWPGATVAGLESGALDATTSGVDLNIARSIHAEASKYAGPYALRTTVTDRADVGEIGTAQVELVTAGPDGVFGPGEELLPGWNLSISVVGADSHPTTVTTNSAGRATFNFRATQAGTVTVNAAASGLPGTWPRMWTSANSFGSFNPNDNRTPQRVVSQPTQDRVTGTASYGAQDTRAQARIIKLSTNPGYQSVAGAQFELRQGGSGGPVVGTMTVGANGDSNLLDGLEPGAYTVVETVTPVGHQTGGPWPVTLATDTATIIELDNSAVADASIALIKTELGVEVLDPDPNDPNDPTDPGGGGGSIPGALISLFRDDNNDGSFETPVGVGPDGLDGTADDGQFITGTEPLVIDGLLAGRYQATELAPPPGLTLPEQLTQIIEVAWNETAEITFEDPRPAISTQINQQTATIGDTITDEITVEGAASHNTGVVTATLYGPYGQQPDATNCIDVDAAASFQIPTNGSGTWTTPGHTVTESGYYTWIAEWVGGDAAVANHTCGDVSETVLVNPTIATQTSHPTIDAGGELTDVITLAGPTASSQGTVVAHLYGPFDQNPVGDSDACTDAPLEYSETLTVGGAGTYNTTPVVVGDHGWYTWVVEYNGNDGTTATHDCGLAAESTIVNPVIATQVTGAEIIEGDAIADAALVGGIGANTPGRITAQAFGPFGAGELIECSDATAATTMIFDVIGPGEHVSPTWVPPTAGVYTFVETWQILTPPVGWPADTTPTVEDLAGWSTGEWTATHQCGQTQETTTVHPRTPAELGAFKFNTDVVGEVIEGATYHLYAVTDELPARYVDCGTAPTAAGWNAAHCTQATPEVQPTDHAGLTFLAEGVTAADGALVFDVYSHTNYCLTEVAAPAGFVMNNGMRCTDRALTGDVTVDSTITVALEEVRETLRLTANKHAADNPGEVVPGAVYDLFLWANHPDQIVQPLHADYFAEPPADLRLPPDPERELIWWDRQTTNPAGDLVFDVPAGFAWCAVEHATVPGYVLDETVRCTAIISEQPPFGERSLALPEQREPTIPGVPTLPATGRETVPLLIGGVGAIVAGLAVLGSRRFIGTKPLTPF